MCHCWNMYHRWDLGSTTLKKSSEILDFCKWFWVIIWPFLGQYLSFGVKWGLYEHYRDTPRPTRTLLVHITPSRTGFRVILVHRDPCDNSEVSVRARSFVTTHLAETCFLTSDDSGNPCEWANTVQETENEPSHAGIGRKLTSVDRKVYMILMRSFHTLWFWIFRFLFNVSNG